MWIFLPSMRFYKLSRTSQTDVHCACACGLFCVHTCRRTHIRTVIPGSISVVDGLGLPKRPFKRKLLKDDYRIETPSFKSARSKLFWKLQQWRDRERTPQPLIVALLPQDSPSPSPSISHLIRERAAVRLLIYLVKIRCGMAVIKTSWLSPAVALLRGNRSEAFRMWECHGWHRSKEHFFNKYI
jgi:hypothetical protein